MATTTTSSSPTARPADERSVPGSVNIPIATWPPSARDAASLDPAPIAASIVRSLNEGLTANDVDAISQLFLKDNCYFRDHLALTWELRTLKGRDAIVAFLRDEAKDRLQKVELDTTTAFRAPRVANLDNVGNVKGVEAFFTFETSKGRGQGFMRLAQQEDGQWKIWTFFTTLRQAGEHVEKTHHQRPQGVNHGADPERKNWKERREAELNFGDGSDPTVLIIGKNSKFRS